MKKETLAKMIEVARRFMDATFRCKTALEVALNLGPDLEGATSEADVYQALRADTENKLLHLRFYITALTETIQLFEKIHKELPTVESTEAIEMFKHELVVHEKALQDFEKLSNEHTTS